MGPRSWAFMCGALAMLTGCNPATQMVLPDGSQGFSISCPGSLQTMGACYEKAGVMCPGGYDVIGGDESRTPFAFGQSSSNSQFSGSANRNSAMVQGSGSSQSSFQGGQFVGRNLMVRCKGGVAPISTTSAAPAASSPQPTAPAANDAAQAERDAQIKAAAFCEGQGLKEGAPGSPETKAYMDCYLPRWAQNRRQ